MDMTASCHDILRSKLFSSIVTEAVEYAELFDAEVRRVLDLQLNPDKSEALIVGNTYQLCVVRSYTSSISVTVVDLPVAVVMKVLGVVLDRRLTFHKHVSMVARLCNYNAQAIRHIRHFSTEIAQCRRQHVAWSCVGSTTQRCAPAPSRNCSEFQKCYSFRSTTKNKEVIAEKPFQNSGVTRRLWTLGRLELTPVVSTSF